MLRIKMVKIMSDQDKLSKIEKDLSFIKRWWPAITAVFAGVWFIINMAVNATSTYDNKIAKKDDIVMLGRQFTELTVQVKRLADEFNSFKIAEKADSIQRAKIKKDLEDHIATANTRYRVLLNRVSSVKFFTEKRVGNQLQVTPVK